jgi:hypothetical protein
VKLFERSPKGRFISYYDVVSEWLPAVMDATGYMGRERVLDLALEALAKWCKAQASAKFTQAAASTEHEWARSHAASAELWLQRAELLHEVSQKAAAKGRSM